MLSVVKYQIAVQTGEQDDGDTSSQAYVKLIGSHGDTGKRQLIWEEDDKKTFEKGIVSFPKIVGYVREENKRTWGVLLTWKLYKCDIEERTSKPYPHSQMHSQCISLLHHHKSIAISNFCCVLYVSII